MAAKQWRNEGSFQAADAGGRQYTVHVEGEWLDAGTLADDGKPAWQHSQFRRYRLADGKAVNAQADGSFLVVATQTVLRRV